IGDKNTADVLLCGTEELDFEPGKNFKFFVCNMTNTDHIHVPKWARMYSLAGHDISHVRSTAEHTLYLALRLLKRSDRSWRPGRTLSGKTATIIGAMGRVGSQLWEILSAMRVNVLPCDLKIDHGITPTQIMKSHFFFVCASVAPNTKPILGRDEIDAMNEGSYIINTSRPQLVNYDAVTSNLYKLGGFAMDFKPPHTKFPPQYLRKMYWTEHTGGYTIEDLKETSRICFDELMRSTL
ncbi:MAG: hypothetical protein EHM49_06295, partial [Deltaproteobacteria bacterium]